MLSLARRYLERTLAVLRDELRTEMPVVVLEPSCAAVFRDELPNLLPDDEDARRLAAQTHLLAGFLREHAPEFAPSELGGRAVLHGHCHQNALFGLDADQELLGRLVELDSPETGCCGMAGSFGYARENYAVSVACAERVLLPAVRAAPEALVVTDGFSCREQIEQLAGRPTMHLAEVLRAALSGTP